MKKVVVFGGGTGMSTLLKGLKMFPLDITAVVSVSDDGKSTGRLRKEFNTVAVGDLRRIIVSLSETEPLVEELLNYRFKTSSDLDGHTIGNLLLTALNNIAGSMSEGIEKSCKILKLKGTVLPLTEDYAILMSKMEDGTIIEGEHNITKANKKIDRVFYKEEVSINKKVLQKIDEADLIIFSMGSLYTSLIPNLLSKDIIKAIDNSNAKIMYICNMMTQPGETDCFKVSDHIRVINEYLNLKKVEIVVANKGVISKKILEKYSTLEQKDQVELDRKNIKNVKLITGDYVTVDNNVIRHKVDKLSLDIYGYLIK